MAIKTPPANLAAIDLPLRQVRGSLYRIHRVGNGPLFFGKTGTNRFDDQARGFGVLYSGLSAEAAFSETFLRNPPAQVISESELALRSIAQIRVRGRLKLVQLYDEGLARMGLTAEIGTCDYSISQAWSSAIYADSRAVDGLIWRGRHDNGTFSVAVFDRSAAKITGAIKSLAIDEKQLERFSTRWGFGLIP